jgi:hypothetical protein
MMGINDLEFEDFIKVLKAEGSIQHEQEQCSYASPLGDKAKISNTRAWKAALWDMYTQGARYLIFDVQGTADNNNSPASPLQPDLAGFIASANWICVWNFSHFPLSRGLLSSRYVSFPAFSNRLRVHINLYYLGRVDPSMHSSTEDDVVKNQAP